MTFSSRNLALFFAAVAFAACGGEKISTDASVEDAGLPTGQPDAELVVDAGPPDTGPIDSGAALDAATVFNQSGCLPCDNGCPGGLCVTNQAGDRFCVDRCDTDLDGCIAGFTCANIAAEGQQETRVCIPPGACTLQMGFGTPCRGDTSLCHLDRTVCQGDVLGFGYCTDSCFSPAGCPSGYACQAGEDGQSVCVATHAPPAQRCAQEGLQDEVPCALDEACPAGTACVGARPGLAGVCAAPCGADDACPNGQLCLGDGKGSKACLTSRCQCRGDHAPDGAKDLLDEALAAVGLDRCSTVYSTADWAPVPRDVAHDPYRLSFFDPVHNEPLIAPAWGRALIGDLNTPARSTERPSRKAAQMVERLATLVDKPVSRAPPGSVDPVAPLAAAAAAFIRTAGGQPDMAALDADAADVPLDLQQAVATVLDGARRGLAARGLAFSVMGANEVNTLFDFGPAFIAARPDGRGIAPANDRVRSLLNTGIAYGELYGGAVDILEAVNVAELDRFAQPATGTGTVATQVAEFLFNQVTPAGRIAIGTGASGIYDPTSPGMDGDWALLIDLGGHDTYRIAAGGNTSRSNGVSIHVDLGGRDRYRYVEVPHPLDGARLPSDADGRYTPSDDPNESRGPISFSQTARQGGGRAGIAVLIDRGTDPDDYRSLRMSQGSGIFGVGVLVDEGGDDSYRAEAVSQGAGTFGIGLLLDLDGDDTHHAYQAAQGFAYARAAGLLYNGAGDDVYVMDVGDPEFGGDPLYGSAQRSGRAQSTLGQGFAFGRRADFSDREFMSGGVGILADGAGNDRYEASIFAQGGGFWFGTGILADQGGNDTYDAIWYAMGTGAHYAMGLLLEGGGDDVYGGRLPRVNVTIGGAHDYTTAFLIDETGNDVYNLSRITGGAGNVNGIGFLVDNAGDDTYNTLNTYGLGGAGLLERGTMEPGVARRKVDTIGVFIDAAGMDNYVDKDGMPTMDEMNEGMWSHPQTSSDDPTKRARERGVGLDGTGESTLHVRW